jgi:hypothetical protein
VVMVVEESGGACARVPRRCSSGSASSTSHRQGRDRCNDALQLRHGLRDCAKRNEQMASLAQIVTLRWYPVALQQSIHYSSERGSSVLQYTQQSV